MDRVIGIIQARMGSTRLPGKALAPLMGRPLLEVLFQRIQRAPVGRWWLATTSQRDDDALASWAEAAGLKVYRGGVEDVLSRFTAILRQTSARWVVRITGDDPFTDSEIIEALIEQANRLASNIDLVSDDPDNRHYPLGFCPQIARASAIVASSGLIPPDQPHHRTHVLSWLYRGNWRALTPPDDAPSRAWRWTVDTETDLQMANAAFSLFGGDWDTIAYPEMVRLLDGRSDIIAINASVPQKTLEEG